MHRRMVKVKDYLLLKNYQDLADLLETKEERIKYLCSKSGQNAKLKKEELEILEKKYFFNRKWLETGEGEMIDLQRKRDNEFLEEFHKLPIDRQEYFILAIKAESLSLK